MVRAASGRASSPCVPGVQRLAVVRRLEPSPPSSWTLGAHGKVLVLAPWFRAPAVQHDPAIAHGPQKSVRQFTNHFKPVFHPG